GVQTCALPILRRRWVRRKVRSPVRAVHCEAAAAPETDQAWFDSFSHGGDTSAPEKSMPQTASPPSSVVPQAPVQSPRWTRAAVEALYELPFNELIHRAHEVHRANFDPQAIQLSTLLSIKTGGCPEDCGYCPQAARYDTGVESQKLLSVEEVLAAASAAKAKGATRFCMGAAWRGPKQKDLEPVLEMVRAVKSLGLETCATLGLLRDGQAEQLRDAGLDYYNHNIDTAPEFYGEVISTRQYEDRLSTLDKVREAGLHVCC